MQSVNSHFMDHTFRAEKMPLVRNHHQVDAMDIHELEMEAYRAVLRAFIAQSDHLSWGKVGLKTDLQKELKVTDSEQNKVDNTALFCTPIGDASRKKLKPSCHSASTAKAYAPPGPPSSAAVPCSFSEHYRNGKQNGRPAIHVDCSVEQSMKLYNPTTQVPSGAKGNCTWISLSRKGFNTQEAVPVTEKSDLIQIRVTRDLINQVQKMVFGKTVLVPAQIEEAKLILRMRQQCLYDEAPVSGHAMVANPVINGHTDGHNGYFAEAFVGSCGDRHEIPCICVQNKQYAP